MSTLLNARLRDYRMLWRAAVMHANPRLSAIIRWGSLALAIVVGAAVTYNDGPRAGVAWFWGAASAFLLLDWAWRFMPGAVKLASPANAKLVPGMRQRLVELSCLMCFVGIAGIASAPYEDSGSVGAWLFWTVFFIAGAGLGVAGHKAGSALIMMACFSSLIVDRLPAALTAMLSHPVVVVLSLPVYAGMIVVAVRAMFPQGGEQHWKMLAQRERWTAAAGKPDPLVAQVGGKKARGWYAAALRRDSARRTGPRLVLHALGPVQHLSEMVMALALLSAVLLALGIFATWRVDPGVMQGVGWMFAALLMFVPLSHSVRLGQLSSNHAGEQALVRLAPVAPARADAFNAQLGRSLLLQALTGWAVATCAALLLVALGGAGPGTLLLMASLCCMVLPVVAVPLRNHASRRDHAVLTAIGLLLASAVQSVPLGLAMNGLTGVPVLPVAAILSIAFTVAASVRGLRRIRQMPCAFPAGRMD